MSNPTRQIQAHSAAIQTAEPLSHTPAGRYQPIPLGEFIRQDVQRRRWAVEGVWAEKRSGIIAGAPKDGKSTISLELGVTLATGTPFLGQEAFPLTVPPARVTYIQAENSTERVCRDLDAILVARGLGYMEEVSALYPDESGWYPAIGDRFQPSWEGTGWEPDMAILSHPGMDLMKHDDQNWLRAYARERDYVFLDPAYLLASANPNDMRDVMTLLAFLSKVRDEADCAIVLTHQMTDKRSDGDPASRMLGSTFLHGWYESAIFTQRNKAEFFTLKCDNLREMGEETRIGAHGLGVGSWVYVEDAQGATDSAGRPAPKTVAKETNLARLRALKEEHPDWTGPQYADELGVSPATVSRYGTELAERSN